MHRVLRLGILIILASVAGCGASSTTTTITQTVSQPAASTTPSPTSTASGSSSSFSETQTQAAPLAGRVVVVDPGHNGGNASHPEIINQPVDAGRGQTKACNTTGTATDSGFDESTFNLAVGEDLRNLLRAAGARVVMTRTRNDGVGPCVNRRAEIGNRAHADAVVAIHADGAPASGRGFHVIYAPPVGSSDAVYRASLELAHDVHDAILASHLLPTSTYLGHDGYDERTDLAGLNLSTRPAIFVELGNMRNPEDAALQESLAGQRGLARALYRGLSKFLGVHG